MTAAATLRAMGACPKALEWARGHGGSLAELWLACPRGDWLLWYARKIKARREDLVRAAAGCAELALPYAGPTRNACEAAIAAARAWADAPGPETAYAARAAAYAARMAVASPARLGRCVHGADAATYAATAARAADAVDAVDAVDAGGKMRAACADVVREHIPFVAVAK